MPRSDWLVVATFVACLGVAALGLADTQERARTAYCAGAGAKHARCKPSQADFDRAGVPRFAERFVSNPEPDEGTERERRDLAAQETSATGALWMVALSGMQVILSALGILFIVKTLRHSEANLQLASAALEHGREVSTNEMRPWLVIKVRPLLFSVDQRQVAIRYEATVKNIGKTPARNVSFEAALFCFGDWCDEEVMAYIASPHIRDAPPLWRDRSIIPNGKSTYRSAATMLIDPQWPDFADNKIISPILVLTATYTWPGHATGGQTSVSYLIGHGGVRMNEFVPFATNDPAMVEAQLRKRDYQYGEVR